MVGFTKSSYVHFALDIINSNLPTGYNRTFNWNIYLSTCKATRAPENIFTKQQMAKVIAYILIIFVVLTIYI